MDHHLVNKTETGKSLYYKLMSWYMEENGKLYLLLLQLINVEGMKETENRHLAPVIEVCDSEEVVSGW